MKKFTDIEETVYFWTRNDSSIISNVLLGNLEGAYKRAELAIGDNKAILQEYADGVRKAGSYFGDPLDYKMIASLKTRLFENLDDNTKKEKILEIAKKDISNIFNEMQPAKNEIMLYRSEWTEEIRNYNIGDMCEFNDILSTCITPYKEDTNYNFYRYEITIPKNGLMLELDQFECHNEDGEVLLPPMKCRVRNIRHSDNEKCKGIVELEYVEKLPVNFA